MTSAAPLPEPLGLRPSFGFGDRIGLATHGHIASLRQAGQGIVPIYAQQSIREMARTDRSPEQVMDDVMHAVQEAGWDQVHGADADHLKTPEDVDRTVAAGFRFFTIDPSDDVDQQADNYSASTVLERFEAVRSQVDWTEHYFGKEVCLPSGTKIEFDELTVKRAAVKYGPAIHAALTLARHIDSVHKKLGRDYEIELSVDETEQPTTLAEHFIIAEQCLQHGMKLVSLAPRFIGDFEKGVDFIGNQAALTKSLEDHAALANQLGPYKLSLHSGSDKLSMYTTLARATKGRFHVKTAGTSYLEALRVVSIHDPDSFREICEFCRERYGIDRATYHVHATLENVPPPSAIPDPVELEQVYLQRWEDVPQGQGFTAAGRQILHCTFGSVLTHDRWGDLLRHCLREHLQTYTEVLTLHFAKHLEALTKGF